MTFSPNDPQAAARRAHQQAMETAKRASDQSMRVAIQASESARRFAQQNIDSANTRRQQQQRQLFEQHRAHTSGQTSSSRKIGKSKFGWTIFVFTLVLLVSLLTDLLLRH